MCSRQNVQKMNFANKKVFVLNVNNAVSFWKILCEYLINLSRMTIFHVVLISWKPSPNVCIPGKLPLNSGTVQCTCKYRTLCWVREHQSRAVTWLKIYIPIGQSLVHCYPNKKNVNIVINSFCISAPVTNLLTWLPRNHLFSFLFAIYGLLFGPWYLFSLHF